MSELTLWQYMNYYIVVFRGKIFRELLSPKKIQERKFLVLGCVTSGHNDILIKL